MSTGKKPTRAEEVETLEDLLDYIETYAAQIFVRVEINGRWRNRSLAQLPGPDAIARAFRFIREHRVPVRLLTEEEVERNARTASTPASTESPDPLDVPQVKPEKDSA